METPLISTWTKKSKKLPPKYVYPPHRRPDNSHAISTARVPIIELDEEETHNRPNLVRKISRAAEEFGVFEVIDHGVSRRLMDETRNITKDFFALPAREKYQYYSTDLNKKFALYSSSIDYDKEALHHWRDAARHSCTPIDECVRYWPQKPLRYREIIGRYVAAQETLGSRILNLLCEGLGLEPGYFESQKLCQDPTLTVNHYPVCPDPTLTWGSREHYDPGLMTILLQDEVPGLQVFHQGTWFSIDPKPYTFLVNVGNLLEIVTNGKLKSVKHRVVTNSTRDRTTTAFFIGARKDCLVQPAKSLVNRDNPPLYRPVLFDEVLVGVRAAFMGEVDCAMDLFLESLKFQ